MVKIRLRRTGKTKQPSYRLVVADSRSPRDGKFIEIIGHYNPIRQPKVLEVKADRAQGTDWVITGGLRAGDRVITQGLSNLREGAAIRAVPASAPQRIAPPPEPRLSRKSPCLGR